MMDDGMSDTKRRVSYQPTGIRDVYWCHRLNEPVIVEYRRDGNEGRPFCVNCTQLDVTDDDTHTRSCATYTSRRTRRLRVTDTPSQEPSTRFHDTTNTNDDGIDRSRYEWRGPNGAPRDRKDVSPNDPLRVRPFEVLAERVTIETIRLPSGTEVKVTLRVTCNKP